MVPCDCSSQASEPVVQVGIGVWDEAQKSPSSVFLVRNFPEVSQQLLPASSWLPRAAKEVGGVVFVSILGRKARMAARWAVSTQ